MIAKHVAVDLGLSEDTIRRDLRELAADGHLQRVHGGALPASPATGDFPTRTTLASAGKRAIARTAATLIKPGQTVILDGGTSTQQLARALPADLQATVLTHSPTIAVKLAAHPAVDVILLGGRLFKHSVVTTGAIAMEDIARYRADTYFMGVTGVQPTAGLTTGNAEEAAVKRALAGRAADTYVLASAEKIGAASPFTVTTFADVTAIITDSDAERATLRALHALGVTVVVAEIA